MMQPANPDASLSDTNSLLRGLQACLEGTVSLEVEALTDQFTVLAEDPARVDTRVWQVVARALNRQERVRKH